MTGSLEVQLSNALHQRDVARRERDDAESRLALKQRAAAEAVDRALELARQLAEVRAELERAKQVLDAARAYRRMQDSLQPGWTWAEYHVKLADFAAAVDAHRLSECVDETADNVEEDLRTDRKLPVCADCGHRHRWGGECADHSWTDACPYEAGADCEAVVEERRQCPETLLLSPDEVIVIRCVRDGGHEGNHWNRAREFEWEPIVAGGEESKDVPSTGSPGEKEMKIK